MDLIFHHRKLASSKEWNSLLNTPPMKVKGLKSFCMIACNGLINLKFKDIRLPNRKYRPEIDFHTIYQKIYKTIHREGKCCNNEE